MTAAQRKRKIDKLSRIRIELSTDASNKGLTPSERMALARACFTDAKRTFAKFCRDFPEDEVTWDRVDEFDFELGAFGSERVMVSVPDSLQSDENVYGLASIQQSIEEDRAGLTPLYDNRVA